MFGCGVWTTVEVLEGVELLNNKANKGNQGDGDQDAYEPLAACTHTFSSTMSSSNLTVGAAGRKTTWI